MDLKISQRAKDGIQILDLDGRLAIGDSETILRESIAALIRMGTLKALLNFEKLKEIDSDGMTALSLCYTRLKNAGGELKLLNLNDVHRDPLALISPDTLEVFVNEQDAINSFFPDRTVAHFDVLEFVTERAAHPPAEPVK